VVAQLEGFQPEVVGALEPVGIGVRPPVLAVTVPDPGLVRIGIILGPSSFHVAYQEIPYLSLHFIIVVPDSACGPLQKDGSIEILPGQVDIQAPGLRGQIRLIDPDPVEPVDLPVPVHVLENNIPWTGAGPVRISIYRGLVPEDPYGFVI